MEQKIKVFFIDDDIFLGQVVTVALQAEGYEVIYQTSLAGARESVIESHPDIIILDVEIGDGNGIKAAPELKAIAPDTPILFVSSHIDSKAIEQALDTGAVTYIKKPFEIDELVAYIKRYAVPYIYRISVGALTLDTETHTLLLGSKIIKPLSESEYKLLKLLAAYPNRMVSRELIVKEVWTEDSPSEQSLNNLMSKLRKYLSEDPQLELTTVKNKGYQLTMPVTDD